MTTLTKTARQEALTRVLKEAFEPKFSDLQKRLVQYTKDWLHTNHPVFEELLTRKDAREYLSTRQFYRMYIGGSTAYYPDYQTTLVGKRISVDEVTVPYVCVDGFVIQDNDLIKLYDSLWDSYKAACHELFKVLAAYRTREALLVDFPEYATYLPAITVKQLPAVIPAESRARLRGLMK